VDTPSLTEDLHVAFYAMFASDRRERREGLPHIHQMLATGVRFVLMMYRLLYLNTPPRPKDPPSGFTCWDIPDSKLTEGSVLSAATTTRCTLPNHLGGRSFSNQPGGHKFRN